MDLSFANPAGFWALLGLPAVVAIHFLQRRARPQVITTLFLLDPLRQESAAGHRFQRLRTSVPFWLQLLMVLGLTWLLVEPRWIRSTSVQRLAVVVDTTASMQAFRDTAVTEIGRRLDSLRPVAAATEYTVLTSAPEEPRLYHGPSARDAVESLASWQPWLGTHDPGPALRAARSAVGRDGIVIFVSDRPTDSPLPHAARQLLVGHALDNVGWTGVTVDEAGDAPAIKALVRNFSNAPAQRSWWLESPDGRKSPPASLDLAAGQSRLVEIAFPAGQDKVVLALAADLFEIDDRLPLVRPSPKSIAVQLPAATTPVARAIRDVFAAFAHTRPADPSGRADLTVAGYDPLAPSLPDGAACVFAADPQPGASYVTGQILAEPGPLLDGLNWQGLLVRDTLPIPRQPQDRVLLWQAERPLVSERLGAAGARQLLFNFDLETSNARKLPGFAILLHRFLEQVRSDIVAPEAANLQAGQKITLARRTGAGALPLTLAHQPLPRSSPTAAPSAPPGPAAPAATPINHAAPLRAPWQPGFFEVTQGPERLLSAASFFADPRESDFTGAATSDTLADVKPVLVEQHSEADSQWRLWVLALLATLAASWFFSRS